MPRYNNARILNFSYNDDSRKIKDIMFPFNGEHTLIHADNGIGKTLTCRLLSTPFTCTVKKNSALYKLIGFDFEDIVTEKNGPTYSCLELSLDNESNGYLLLVVGLEEIPEKEKVIKTIFTVTYKDCGCELSIKNFPFYDENGKLRKVKTLYDLLKGKSGVRTFGEYTNNSMANYTDFLAEYNISIDEKLLALKAIGGEGGLTDIFKNETSFDKFFSEHLMPLITRQALVDKENEENAFDGFKKNIVANATDKKTHKSKIDSLKEYNTFVSDLDEIKKITERIQQASDEKNDNHIQFLKIVSDLRVMSLNFHKQEEIVKEEIKQCQAQKVQVEIDEINYHITDAENKINVLKTELDNIKKQKENVENLILETNKKIYSYQSKKLLDEIEAIKGKIKILEERKQNFENNNSEYQKLNKLGGLLLRVYNDELDKIGEEIVKITTQKIKNSEELDNTENERDKSQSKLTEVARQIGKIDTVIEQFEDHIKYMFEKYSKYDFPSKFEIITKDGIEDFVSQIKKKQQQIQVDIKEIENNILKSEQDKKMLEEDNTKILQKQNDLAILQNEKCQNRKRIIETIQATNDELKKCDILDIDIKDIEGTLSIIKKKMSENEELLFAQKTELQTKETLLKNLKNHEQIIDSALEAILSNNSIDFKYGYSILQEFSEEKRKIVLEQIPLLPYAIVVDNNELIKLKKHHSQLLSQFCTPILSNEYVYSNMLSDIKNTYGESMHIFVSIPENFYQDDYLNNAIEKTEKEKKELQGIINVTKSTINCLNTAEKLIIDLSYVCKGETIDELNKTIDELNEQIHILDEDKNKNLEEINKIKDVVKSYGEKLNELHTEKINIENFYDQLEDFQKGFILYKQNSAKKRNLEEEKLVLKENIDEISEKIKGLKDNKEKIVVYEKNLSVRQTELQTQKPTYEAFAHYIPQQISDDINIDAKKAEFNQLKNVMDISKQGIEDQLVQLYEEHSQKEKDFGNEIKVAEEYGITKDNCKEAIIIDIIFEKQQLEKYRKKQNEINIKQGSRESELKSSSEAMSQYQDDLSKYPNATFIPMNNPYDFKHKLKRLHQQEISLAKKHTNIENDIKKIDTFLNGRDKSNDKQVPTNTPSKYTITTENFESVANQVGKQWRAADKKHTTAIDELKQFLEKIQLQYCEPKILEFINNLRFSSNDINVAKIETITTRCKSYIEFIQKEIGFIEKNYAQIIMEAKSFAQKLLSAFQQYDSVANQIKFSDNTKAVEFKNIKNDNKIRPDPENVQMFIDRIIEHSIMLDEIEIKQYIDKQLTEEQLLRHYIDISQVKLFVAKKDGDTFRLTQYENVIANKVSGAQKLLASFALLLLICRYQSLTYNHKYATSLIQDNPFGTSSTDGFVDAMFDLANACSVQLISFTALKEEHIFEKHPVFLKYVLNKTKSGKEVVSIKTNSENNETVSLFQSSLMFENIES